MKRTRLSPAIWKSGNNADTFERQHGLVGRDRQELFGGIFKLFLINSPNEPDLNHTHILIDIFLQHTLGRTVQVIADYCIIAMTSLAIINNIYIQLFNKSSRRGLQRGEKI